MDDLAAELEEALVDQRRLARYRRILVTALVVLGAALFALSRFDGALRRRPMTMLSVAWCGLWLPTFRVLIFESYKQRLIDRLSASLDRSKR